MHTRKTVIQLIIIILTISAVIQAGGNDKIKLVPFDRPYGEFGPVGFKIYVPWMSGNIDMRYPETIDGQAGMYFIDHNRPDMQPISKMHGYPEWKTDETTGGISYSYTTAEGVEFGGYAVPEGDKVQLEFIIKNHSDKPLINLNPQVCLELANSNDFNLRYTASDVYLWVEGKCTCLADLTPSAEEKGRNPLMIIAKKGFVNLEGVGKTKYPGLGQDVFMSNYVKDSTGKPMFVWWEMNQEANEDIILKESRDKNHLVAVSWPGSVSYLIYNSLNPCIHAGPSIQFTIEPKRERHWYGTIYLMQNDKNKLLDMYRDGQRAN